MLRVVVVGGGNGTWVERRAASVLVDRCRGRPGVTRKVRLKTGRKVVCDGRQPWGHTGEHVFEIRHVHGRTQRRDVRYRNRLGVHLIPIDRAEINMPLDQRTRKPPGRVPF